MWVHLTKYLSLKNVPFPHTYLETTHKIAVTYLGHPHLVPGQVSECKASFFKLVKLYEHWISRYQSQRTMPQ